MRTVDIILRIFLAILMSGLVGFDREFKNRPAGIRTHILVCLGATMIAMLQREIGLDSIAMAQKYPELAGVVRSDEARLIAQVVSGIGFLGAGTIIVTKRTVKGLTTAASLWTVAALGLVIGMGYYEIAIIGCISILLVLSVLNRLVKFPTLKRVEISFIHKQDTKEFINDYFQTRNIEIRDVDFEVTNKGDRQIYTNVYTIELPKSLSFATMVEELSMNKNMVRVRLISV
ncbi:MAG TPA: MgtC/SapB family protein [Candidatus Tetragenococcus pullicola]|nr:MgtC/SapB family protein [Candidatus Tetragenococcus pullicola]